VAFTDSSGRTKSALADINITPLVDVVLVLLVIFMLTAPVLQSGIDVAVPKTRTVREATEQHEVITIDRDQRVFLGDHPINVNEIPASVPSSAARGVSLRMVGPMNAPRRMIKPMMNAQASPASHALRAVPTGSP